MKIKVYQSGGSIEYYPISYGMPYLPQSGFETGTASRKSSGSGESGAPKLLSEAALKEVITNGLPNDVR